MRQTRKRQEQLLVPGFLTSVWHTPIMTEGNLPGGGRLFEVCTRAAEVASQMPLPGSCGRCGGSGAAGAAGLCRTCDESACPTCGAQKTGWRAKDSETLCPACEWKGGTE